MTDRSKLPVLMLVLNEVEHDNRVLKCARHLISLGYPVTVFGLSNDRAVEKPFLKRVSGIPVRLFPHPRFHLKSAPNRSFNYRAHQSHLIASWWAHFEKMKPAILHTHDFNTLAIGRELVEHARQVGMNPFWIHDFHEYVKGLASIDEGVRNIALADQDASIHFPDRLITVSPHLSDALRRDYNLRVGPLVILNSNPIDSYSAEYKNPIRRTLQLAADVPLAVYTGGVSRPRGVHTLVEALTHIPEMHVALVTNNTGEYVDSLKRYATLNNCSDRLHVLPYVAPDEVPSFIQDATVCVHPMVHFENAEVALPNKLFDYCIARVPCVVSDCKAMSEFVNEWRVGEVFKAEDVGDLTKALLKVIANRDEYVRRLSGQSNFVKYVAWEPQCEKLTALYARAEWEIEFAKSQNNWAGLKRGDQPAALNMIPLEKMPIEVVSSGETEARAASNISVSKYEQLGTDVELSGFITRMDDAYLIGSVACGVMLHSTTEVEIEIYCDGLHIASGDLLSIPSYDGAVPFKVFIPPQYREVGLQSFSLKCRIVLPVHLAPPQKGDVPFGEDFAPKTKRAARSASGGAVTSAIRSI